MGYYTKYNLEVEGGKGSAQLIGELINSNKDARAAILRDGNTKNKCMWSCHENDLKEFSKKYPNNTFILSGEGEDFPDLWKKRFINGEMARVDAVITYPDFDCAVMMRPTMSPSVFAQVIDRLIRK
jgi:hypothetical protein